MDGAHATRQMEGERVSTCLGNNFKRSEVLLVVVCGIFNMIVYIKNGKEKNNSLCLFVPGDATVENLRNLI